MPSEPPEGPPDNSWTSGRASYTPPGLLLEPLEPTGELPGPPGGPPDTSRTFGRASQPSRTFGRDSQTSRTSGRAYRTYRRSFGPLPNFWVGLLDLQEGLPTTFEPLGGPPDQSRTSRRTSRPSQTFGTASRPLLEVGPPNLSHTSGCASRTTRRTSRHLSDLWEGLPTLRDLREGLPTTPGPLLGPLDPF